MVREITSADYKALLLAKDIFEKETGRDVSAFFVKTDGQELGFSLFKKNSYPRILLALSVFLTGIAINLLSDYVVIIPTILVFITLGVVCAFLTIQHQNGS